MTKLTAHVGNLARSLGLAAIGLVEKVTLFTPSVAAQSSDATLTSLTVSNGTADVGLIPSFSSATTSYTVALKYRGELFTDDAGNAEALTSAATANVAAQFSATVHDVPSSHDGTEFTFELRFSETPKKLFSYKTLRGHAFVVAGGDVVNARRLVHGKNVRWEITISPSSDATVTVELLATTDCNAVGAICTDDNRKLTAMPAIVVTGPP